MMLTKKLQLQYYEKLRIVQSQFFDAFANICSYLVKSETILFICIRIWLVWYMTNRYLVPLENSVYSDSHLNFEFEVIASLPGTSTLTYFANSLVMKKLKWCVFCPRNLNCFRVINKNSESSLTRQEWTSRWSHYIVARHSA